MTSNIDIFKTFIMVFSKMIIGLSGILFIIMESPASAQSDPFYCVTRKLGHYFYCEKPKPGKPVKEKSLSVVPQASARERIGEIRAQLEEMRAVAVLEPTTTNVSAYIRFQRKQLDRASRFADVWQRTLWQQPELDYTLTRPVSNLAKKVWSDTRSAEQEDLLAHLGERYGIFYIYSGSCGACRAFSPLMRAFADRYNLPVKAVSTDGSLNDYFPDATQDIGQAAALGFDRQPVPAVILFDAVNHAVIPVGFGLMTEQELKERIYLLILKGAGDDY